MKVKPKQYALSLYEMLKPVQHDKNAQKRIISGFASALKGNNDISKIDEIIGEFENIWNKKEGIVEAEVLSANELDNDTVSLLKNYVKKISGAQEVLIEKKREKGILGGIVLRYADKVIDASLKTKVQKLRENMIK